MDKKVVILIVAVLVLLCCCVSIVAVYFAVIAPKLNPGVTDITPTGVVNYTTTTPSKVPNISDVITPTKATITQVPQKSACTPMLTGDSIIFPSVRVSSNEQTVTSIMDKFNTNENEWALGPLDSEYATTKSYIQNGKYCIDITAKRDVISKDMVDSQSIKNFDISVEGWQSSGTKGADYDLIFRYQDSDNFYVFGVNQYYGDYYISKVVDNEWTDLVDNVENSAINSDSPNVLKVVANNDYFNFYVNGVLVKALTDSTFSEAGNVGIAVGLDSEKDNAVFELDNFSLVVNNNK
jgi:hypothetical protein